MKLTKRVIESLEYAKENGKQHIVWDQQLSAFGVRVYPSGQKTYVLTYRQQGVKRIMALGPCNVLTLEQARDRAIKHRARILDGADPLAEKKKARGAETVRELAADYIARHARVRNRTWERDERRLARWVTPVWGTRKVAAVTREDVSNLHRKAGADGGPYEANRVLSMLGKMFECAKDWGYLPENATNPARKVAKFHEAKRDRWVTQEEMPRLLRAIDDEDNEYIRAAFLLYLLTGLRRSELLNTRWPDVDLTRGELRVPDTKNRSTHHLPLSLPAVAILRSLPRMADNPHVFPGRVDARPLVELKSAWDRVRTRAEVKDVRLHDLRRTVGSWLAQAGNSLHLIGRVLNHKTVSTTAIYAHFGQDAERKALEDHGERVLKMINGKRETRKARK